MSLSTQMGKHLRNVYFGGNWADSNLKDNLSDVTWQEATTQIYGLNTILALLYHVNYYVHEVAKVLEGEPLQAKDKYSFQHPPITNQTEWENLLAQAWKDGEHFANLIEKLPDSILLEDFTDEKYGNYFSNIHGIIEHIHYHLGQIVIIKKILRNK